MDVHEAAIAHVNRAWEWFAGMVALSATNIGVELGIFNLLKKAGPLTPEEIAARLQLQPRPVDLWAKTLVHYELLVPDEEGRVSMAPGLELMVCEPRTLFNLTPSLTYHARFLARDFLELPQFFKDGVPVPPSRHGAALTVNVAEQTSMMHAVFVSSILPSMPELLSRFAMGARVLDVCCGTANLAILLCMNFPAIRYTGIDLDEAAIAIGREVASGADLDHQIELIHGEAAGLERPGEFEVAFLFLALHEIPLDTRPAVLAAIRRSLKPGGLLLLLDETYPENLSQAAERQSRMGLHFEYTEMLWGSRVAARSEIDTLLQGAGFAAVERLPALEGSFEVVVARTV